jgi:hypothetical protein
MPSRRTRTQPTPPITTPRARTRSPRPDTPAPAPEPMPEPQTAAPELLANLPEAPAPTVSDTFAAKVQALLELAQQGPDAVAEALRAGRVIVRSPRTAGSRVQRNGLSCTPRQGSFLLYAAEHGHFVKGSSKVRDELHRLGLIDSNATDAHLTDAGRAACEALRTAGVSAGGWQVQR